MWEDSAQTNIYMYFQLFHTHIFKMRSLFLKCELSRVSVEIEDT